jgi:hypothetical protein
MPYAPLDRPEDVAYARPLMMTSQEKLIRENRQYLRLSRRFARGLRLRLAMVRGVQVPESEEDMEALGLVELACSRRKSFLRP